MTISRRSVFSLLVLTPVAVITPAVVVRTAPERGLGHDLYTEGFPAWAGPGTVVRHVHDDHYVWGHVIGEPYQDGDCNGVWMVAVAWDNGSRYSHYVGDLYYRYNGGSLI